MDSRLAVDFTHALVPLTGSVRDDQTLFGIIGDAPIVLIGESTHGTHEFYRARVEITKRLVADYGFSAVCVEGDWPDADRVNRYVRGTCEDAEAIDSRAAFGRFPEWMWRNAEVSDFVAWLREYNDRASAMERPKAGFYGLDVYGTSASVDVVLKYLDEVDPAAAARARGRFEGSQPAVEAGERPECRDEIVAELVEIHRKASPYARTSADARIAAHAEEYYRAMLDESVSIWTLRDAHMMDTLERLLERLASHRGGNKAVVWAHNSHAGLAQRRFGQYAVSIGFTTYTGTVTAASRWHGAQERKPIAPARGDSYEYLFHDANVPRFLLPLRPHRPKLTGLPQQARERAIGAIYRPHTEPFTHYFTARLIDQFDALYHFDVTRALEPL